MTAETTTAGAGAASPGSCHELETENPDPDRECRFSALGLLLLAELDDWEGDFEIENEGRSFQETPIESLSFQEEGISVLDFPFEADIGTGTPTGSCSLTSEGLISKEEVAVLAIPIRPATAFPKEWDKEVGGVLNILLDAAPVDAKDDEDEEDDEEGELA